MYYSDITIHTELFNSQYRFWSSRNCFKNRYLHVCYTARAIIINFRWKFEDWTRDQRRYWITVNFVPNTTKYVKAFIKIDIHYKLLHTGSFHWKEKPTPQLSSTSSNLKFRLWQYVKKPKAFRISCVNFPRYLPLT